VKAQKRKSPNGADPKRSAKEQIDAIVRQARRITKEQFDAEMEATRAEMQRLYALADAYHRNWLAAMGTSVPSPEALANHEFILALIRGGSLEYDPETDTFQAYVYVPKP
jgi:hypothetical protein